MNSRVRSDNDRDELQDESGSERNRTEPLKEIEAMTKVAAALAEVDPDSARRILRWAGERFGGVSPAPPAGGGSSAGPSSFAAAATDEDLGELFAQAAPTNGPERALVVAYWLQVVKGQDDLEGQMVNAELKNLGHGLPNITATMSLLMGQQPALVIQTRKIGSSQQGRKRYRVTTAGIGRVRQMLAGGGPT
jgi:hypothetical protein